MINTFLERHKDVLCKSLKFEGEKNHIKAMTSSRKWGDLAIFRNFDAKFPICRILLASNDLEVDWEQTDRIDVKDRD